MNDNFIVVKLNQYAGNVDEIVSVALTGHGNHRHGYDEALALYEEKVNFFLPENFDMGDGFVERPTDRGDGMYRLNGKNCNNLDLFFYLDEDEAKKRVDIWKKAYTNDQDEIEIRVEVMGYDKTKTVVVKILGFEFGEVVTKQTPL